MDATADAVSCLSTAGQPADLNGLVPASGYLLVTEPDSQEIEKAIRLDNQYHLPQENLERFAEPVLYLPWCATVANALEKMSHRDREVTVVVNELGDTIGILTIEDILETVFVYSPSRTQRLLDMPPLEELGMANGASPASSACASCRGDWESTFPKRPA